MSNDHPPDLPMSNDDLDAKTSGARASAPRSDETEIDDPGMGKVRDYLLYGLSLPERTLRTTSGMVGGLLHESATLLVPQAFRSSKTYGVFIQQMLDFAIKDVGCVKHSDPVDGKDDVAQVENFVARKAVGNFVEMAGWATLHLSPIMMLALVSDIAYGSREYLNELSDELKKQGLIDQDTTIDHAADMLDALSSASGVTASAFDTPPLSVEGLRESVRQTQDAVASIDITKTIPRSEMERLWAEMHEIANREGVSVMDVSSAMSLHAMGKIGRLGQGALSGARVAGNLFERHVFDHYTTALTDIKERGFYASLAASSQPYVEAVWTNFSTDKTTLTEDVLSGKTISQAWKSVNRWLGGRSNLSEDSSANENSDGTDQ